MLRDTKSPAQQRKSLNPDPAARCCPARLWHRAVVNRMEKIETERRSSCVSTASAVGRRVRRAGIFEPAECISQFSLN